MNEAPQMEELFALFPHAGDLPAYELVPADELPQPYRNLLVHEEHMTVTVEAFHGGVVDVRVLESRQDGPQYARKILLVHRASGKIVLFGIVVIDFALTSPDVRTAILSQGTPLGRILIENDVLRRIEPTAYVRIRPGPAQLAWFGLPRPQPFYGRLAIIHCDGKPAVELLEVVCP